MMSAAIFWYARIVRDHVLRSRMYEGPECGEVV